MTYDGLGNIRSYSNTSSFKPHNLSYSYSSNNRLSSVTGTGSTGYRFNRSDSYDKRGNITHNGKRNFAYNLANQMTQSGSNRYVYDGYNCRIKTTDSKGISYSMYSQAGKLLYRETEQGGINYIFLGDKLIAKEGVGVKASGDSIMNYKPFGDSIETAKDDVGYTGHKFDTDLGLSYMQARYYDPVIGRFYSNDPVGTLGHMELGNPVQGFNRYAYANNNPYKYTDPDGQFLQFIPAIIAVAKVAHKAYKVYKSNKRIQKVLKNKQNTGKKGDHTSSNGSNGSNGSKEADKDFKTLTKGSDVKTYENGTKVGKTPDGRTVDKHGSRGKSGKGSDVKKGTESIKIKNESGKRTQTTIRYPEDKT